jgi:hypothetical protein
MYLDQIGKDPVIEVRKNSSTNTMDVLHETWLYQNNIETPNDGKRNIDTV